MGVGMGGKTEETDINAYVRFMYLGPRSLNGQVFCRSVEAHRTKDNKESDRIWAYGYDPGARTVIRYCVCSQNGSGASHGCQISVVTKTLGRKTEPSKSILLGEGACNQGIEVREI